MTATATLKLSGDFELFSQFMDGEKFKPVFEREIKRATLKNCLYCVAAIKTEIKQRRYEENGPLTLALTRNSIPLLKEKNLVDAIAYRLDSALQAEIGIIGTHESTGGVTRKTYDLVKVATLLHEGYLIKITPKMVAAIMAALRYAKALKHRGASRALGAIEKNEGSTGFTAGVWRVPPRPFMTQVLERPDIEERIRKTWREALEIIYQKMGAKDGEHKDTGSGDTGNTTRERKD